MTNHRCSLCDFFGCRHVNPRLPTEPNHGSRNRNLEINNNLGEQIGDAMEDFSGVVSSVSTMPMGPSPAANERVLIPPPPRVPNIPGVPMTAGPAAEVNRVLQTIDMKNDWVHCNICKARVMIEYLDKHQKVHIENVDIVRPSSKSSSTAIVPIVNPGPHSLVTTHSSNPKRPSINIERYKFRQLEQACCASSVSSDGRYSDFTIIFWEQEKSVVYSAQWNGGTSYSSKEWERFTVHVVYDSREDYYTVSSKLSKRSSYGSYDNDEVVPDRICNQDELFTEIKRALLFFRISPKAAYKHFRRLFKQELMIDYDNNGRAIVVQTKNCMILNDRLKKSPGSMNSHLYDHSYD